MAEKKCKNQFEFLIFTLPKNLNISSADALYSLFVCKHIRSRECTQFSHFKCILIRKDYKLSVSKLGYKPKNKKSVIIIQI